MAERTYHFGALIAPIPSGAWEYPISARGLSVRAECAPSLMRDQGELGSCTGFAFGCAINSMHGAGLVTAPLALYYDFRTESGFQADQDSGAFMEPAVAALVKFGAGSESAWEYPDPTPGNFAERPSWEYKRQALDHRVTKHYRATTAVQAKTAISNGLPVVVAFNVPMSFLVKTKVTGVWVDEGGPAQGGHAVCIMGYDDEKHGGSFRIQNSWSADWGEGGFFWLPYDAYEGSRWWDGIVLQTMDMEAGS